MSRLDDPQLEELIAHENEHWSKVFASEMQRSKTGENSDFSSEWWRNYYAEMTDFVRNWLSQYPDPRILEAGSGSGKASILLGKELRRTFLDISPVALEYAKYLAKKFDASNIDFVQGDVFRMPFEDSAFDFVWNIGVLEHYASDEVLEILDEMVRVTGPGGSIAVGVPNFRSGPILKARLLGLRVLSWVPGYRLDSERDYRAAELRSLMHKATERAGKEIVEEDCRAFGNPLPMETPGFLLKTLGRSIAHVFPSSKFLTFITIKIQ